MKHSSSQSGVAQMGWKEVLDAKKIFYGAIFCFFSTAGQSRNNDRLRQDAIKGKCLFPDLEILAPNSWAKDQFAEIRVCRNDYFDKKWLEILRYFFLSVHIKLSLSQSAQLVIHFSWKWVLLHLFEGPFFKVCTSKRMERFCKESNPQSLSMKCNSVTVQLSISSCS